MTFNLAEKLAIIKAIDEVVLVDGQVNQGEISFMRGLMGVLKIDQNLIPEARKITGKEGLLILKAMPDNKKQALAVILQEMANADGRVDEREIDLILSIFSAAGIGIDNN
jgi:uncharacterized tellurite resistance protein B-like protein